MPLEFMPIDVALVVAAISAAFFVFAGTLAWAQHQTHRIQ
jgi:hypothetical protein